MPANVNTGHDQTMIVESSDTTQKALELNLNPQIYGTIAEIGAGQEVAANFFRAGGAAGTVAKTISAYDMKVSDEIYGKAGRYVSRERVGAMVEREFELLQQRLGVERADSCFFAFADSVAARNYAGTNECHGWLGLRFQTRPGGEPNDILLHVNLCDQTNLRQQRALGILGVNLIHAAYHQLGSLNSLLDALFDDLNLRRMEIDLVHMSGPDVPTTDDCGIGLGLVRRGLALVVCLDASGELAPPTEVIRKRPIAIERGVFRNPQNIHPEMLRAGIARLSSQMPEGSREVLGLFELSVENLREEQTVSDAEYVKRLRYLFQFGFCVLLTRLRESYSVTEYLRRYSLEPMCYNTGVSTLALMFAEGYYTQLAGGLVEATGKLLANNVKIYTHAMSADDFKRHLGAADTTVDHVLEPETDRVTVANLALQPPVSLLYQYLVAAGWIEGVD